MNGEARFDCISARRIFQRGGVMTNGSMIVYFNIDTGENQISKNSDKWGPNKNVYSPRTHAVKSYILSRTVRLALGEV